MSVISSSAGGSPPGKSTSGLPTTLLASLRSSVRTLAQPGSHATTPGEPAPPPARLCGLATAESATARVQCARAARGISGGGASNPFREAVVLAVIAGTRDQEVAWINGR